MRVVAHRGLHRTAPENSPAAIQAALSAGLALIEVDVRATHDGELFLLHDATLDRTSDLGGSLRRLTAVQASRARLKDGTPLPHLAPVVDLCAGRAVLCLDVKERRAAEPLLRLLRGYESRVEVWSVHAALVREASAAGIRATLICAGVLRHGIGHFLWQAREAGAAAVSFYPADIEPHVVAACHHAAMPFLCGTPNDERTWQALENMGAYAAITDQPLACLDWLSAQRGPELPADARACPRLQWQRPPEGAAHRRGWWRRLRIG